MEHFVRRADFESETVPKDFGFLVPTPPQPKLSEVPDLVFDQLGEVMKPEIKVEKVTKISFMPWSLSFLDLSRDERVASKETITV